MRGKRATHHRLRSMEARAFESATDIADFLRSEVLAALRSGDTRGAVRAVEVAAEAVSRLTPSGETWEQLQERYDEEALRHNVLVITVGNGNDAPERQLPAPVAVRADRDDEAEDVLPQAEPPDELPPAVAQAELPELPEVPPVAADGFDSIAATAVPDEQQHREEGDVDPKSLDSDDDEPRVRGIW